MTFDIYKHKFTIKNKISKVEEEYELIPVTGEHIEKVFSVMKKMNSFIADDGENVDLSKLDTSAMKEIHEIALETFKVSYPKQDVGQLNQFVTQNLMQLIDPIMKVNTGNNE